MSTEARRPVPPVRPPHDPAPSSAPRPPRGGEAEQSTGAATPPPPAATARFPDAPPAVGSGHSAQETTVRLRPVPPGPARRPAAQRPQWGPPAVGTAATASASAGPVGAPLPAPASAPSAAAPARPRGRLGAALACGLLGTGLLAAGVTAGITGGADGAGDNFAEARELWRTTPVDELFPPSVKGRDLGPGGADRTWNRVAVAPDGDCSDAFDPALRTTLAPVGCERLLRATYADATRSHLVTVGLLFTEGDADGMRALRSRVTKDRLDRRTDRLPRPFAAEGTLAEGFGDRQRASWALDVLTEAPVVVYAVSGWADGREVTKPVPAPEALQGSTDAAPAQAGLGHDAGRLTGLFARDLRRTVAPPRETPS